MSISPKDIKTLLAVVNRCVATIENYTINDEFQADVEDLRNNFDLLYCKVDDMAEACSNFIGDFDKEG